MKTKYRHQVYELIIGTIPEFEVYAPPGILKEAVRLASRYLSRLGFHKGVDFKNIQAEYKDGCMICYATFSNEAQQAMFVLHGVPVNSVHFLDIDEI